MTYTYVLVYLIKGKAKKYHLTLTKSLAKKFKIENVGSRIPPHITLKFLNKNITRKQLGQLLIFLKNFSKQTKKVKLNLNGINHFTDQVIFMDVIKSRNLLDFYKNLYGQLVKFKWMPITKFEGENIHFHATLAVDDVSTEFTEIYNFLSRRNPRYELNLDNITLMRGTFVRKNRYKWKIYKEFKLK